MKRTDQIIYKILLWACPFLLSGLITVGWMAGDLLLKLNRAVMEIRISLKDDERERAVMSVRYESLEKRITHLEKY